MRRPPGGVPDATVTAVRPRSAPAEITGKRLGFIVVPLPAGDVPAGRVLRRPRQPTRSSSGSPAGSSCATTCATPADRPPSTPTCPATRCATSSPTPSAYSTGSASPAHTRRARASGFIAQLVALDHPSPVASLVLVGTRPVAPGPVDDDLPEHSPAIMAHFGSAPAVDWTDRTSILDGAVASARVLSGSPRFDADEARAHAAAILDRAGPHPASARNGLMSTVFAALDCTPRWRERLPGIIAPTLVVHGAADPFFPLGNAEALAAEIPGATLLALDGVGAELPGRAHAEVAAAVLAHTAP